MREEALKAEEKWDDIYPNATKLYCEIKGTFARSEDARELVNVLKHGYLVDLEPESDNKHDSFAVKVIFETEHIGYIPSEDSEEIHTHIENGGNYIAFVEDIDIDPFDVKAERTITLLVYLDEIDEGWEDDDEFEDFDDME